MFWKTCKLKQLWKLLSKLNFDEDTADNNLFLKLKTEIWKEVHQYVGQESRSNNR